MVMLNERQSTAAYDEQAKKEPYEAKWAGSEGQKEVYRRE